jgi:hypothetical protein
MFVFLTIFVTDFNNNNYIDNEDLIMIIDRLTQKKQLSYPEKQKIMEGVSTKCFFVFFQIGRSVIFVHMSVLNALKMVRMQDHLMPPRFLYPDITIGTNHILKI